MLQTALITFGVAVGLLLVLVVLFAAEDKREQRLVAAGLRTKLDRWFYSGSGAVITATTTRVQQMVAASYRAVARWCLRKLIAVAGKLQVKLLHVYRQHRVVPQRGDELGDSYFGQVAAHKRDSAMSAEEVERIKSHS